MDNAPQVSKDDQNWAMACHLSALAGFLVPFGNIAGPLLVWLLKRAEIPLVDAHGKEALNFQITVSIAIAVCIPLMFILIGIPLAIRHRARRPDPDHHGGGRKSPTGSSSTAIRSRCAC